ESRGPGLQLVCYKPLFSGPAVERIDELQFQRPGAEISLSRADARSRGIANGATVTVSHNGTSVQLRARVTSAVRAGVALVPEEHAAGLHGGTVEVSA